MLKLLNSQRKIRDVTEPSKIRFRRMRISHLISIQIRTRIYRTIYLCYQTRA